MAEKKLTRREILGMAGLGTAALGSFEVGRRFPYARASTTGGDPIFSSAGVGLPSLTADPSPIPADGTIWFRSDESVDGRLRFAKGGAAYDVLNNIVNGDISPTAAIANSKIVGLANLGTNTFSSYPLTPVTDFPPAWGGYDYIVLQNSAGTVYTAYDSAGNNVASDSVPDVANVINALWGLSSFPATGADILIAINGTVNVSNGTATNYIQTPKSNSTLRGLGKYATKLLWNSSGGSGGSSGIGVVMAGFGSTTTTQPGVSDLTLKNMTIDGNSVVDCTHTAQRLTHFLAEDVAFDHPSFTHNYNSITGATGFATYDWLWEKCEFYNLSGGTSVCLALDTDYSIWIDAVRVNNCYFDSTCGGYSISGTDSNGTRGLSNVSFTNNVDYSANGGPDLTGFNNVISRNNQYANNNFFATKGLGLATGGFGATGGGVVSFAFGNKFLMSAGFGGTITSAQPYTVFHGPLDVSIGAGTGQTITTKDALGNTIDNAVATLSHRLLKPNYQITVTYSALGTVTIVDARVGPGGTSTPQANVNYCVWNADELFMTGGSGLTATVSDGTTNTGGNVIDNAITGNPTHALTRGQVLKYTAITTSPVPLVIS